MSWFDQSQYNIKFEWGLEGATRLSSSSDVVIVVDVLSFTTCVEAALESGATVYPYLYKDSRADEFAKSIGARLASLRRSKHEICLSPPSLLQLDAGDKIVLPSPNGSTICFSVDGPTVIAGCLRNASAVAEAAQRIGRKILVIASGERWPNQELRPSIEDIIGAGAILTRLSGTKSPESESAVAVFHAFEKRIQETIENSSSGRDLVEKGFPEDVEYAAALNISSVVPVLRDRSFSVN